MKNGKRSIASAASNAASKAARAAVAALVAALLGAGLAATAAAQVSANWQQHVLPATDSTKLIAIAGTPGRDALGVLYTDAAQGRGDQLRLATFDAAGTQKKSADLGARAEALREHAAVALDAGGGAFVATTEEGGGVRISRLDGRGAVTAFGKPLVFGGGAAKVAALLLARQGNLVVAGAADGKGFVAALSPQGEPLWSRTFDELADVLDVAESGDGFIVAGGTPGEMAMTAVWYARLGADGTVQASETLPGPTRYAHLASDGRRIGLLYEKLDTGLETGSVVLQLFDGSAPLRQAGRQTLFTGRLAAPFVLSGAGGRFTAAGVAEHGRLHVVEIDGAGKQETLFRGQAKAPDYLRFHSVEVVRDTAAAYLAGLRSRAEGPRRRYELVFARIPDR